MQLAIGTTFDYELAIDQQLEELRSTAFSSISLGGNAGHSGYLKREGQQRLLWLTNKYNLEICSLHAPFTTGFNIANSYPEQRMAAVCRIAMCMASAKELGSDTVILHLDNSYPEQQKQDVDSLLYSLESLIESGETMQIKLAAENLPNKESLEFLDRALAEFDSELFGFCYDSSHDLISPNEPYQLLERYAGRLFAVHLSDNDGKEDRHWIPFTGIVDWERICSILSANSYSLPLLLEVENRERIDPAQFLKTAAVAAGRLHDMISS